MYLLTASKLVIHEPFQVTWELKLFTPPVSRGKFCPVTALHGQGWLTGTEKQLRGAGSAVGTTAGFLCGVWISGLRKQTSEAQGENVVLGWYSLAQASVLMGWAGVQCQNKSHGSRREQQGHQILPLQLQQVPALYRCTAHVLPVPPLSAGLRTPPAALQHLLQCLAISSRKNGS